jgi:hypothetical protein
MSNKDDCTFKTGNEVTTVGDFFDRDPKYLAHGQDGTGRGCHKGKPKGVSYALCT